jgi:outer membrane lipoprotein SlyB
VDVLAGEGGGGAEVTPIGTALPALPDRGEYERAVTQRDALAKRMGEILSSADRDETKAALDAAATRFEQALATVKANPAADPGLVAFARAVSDIQSQTEQMTEQLLARRLEQVARLGQLKKRLDERMKIRQEKAWAADAELAKLDGQLSSAKRRHEAAQQSGAEHAASELAGEVSYLEGLVEARRGVLGVDAGDRRAVAEVQSLMDEATAAAEADKAAANGRLEEQRRKLDGMLAGSMDESRRAQAAELQKRLDELSTARAAYMRTKESKATAEAEERQKVGQQLAAAEREVLTLNGQVMAHLAGRYGPVVGGWLTGAAVDSARVQAANRAGEGRVITAAVTGAVNGAVAESGNIVARWKAINAEIEAREDRQRRQVVAPAVGAVGRVDPRQSWALAAFGLVLGLGRLLFAKRVTAPDTAPEVAGGEEAGLEPA